MSYKCEAEVQIGHNLTTRLTRIITIVVTEISDRQDLWAMELLKTLITAWRFVEDFMLRQGMYRTTDASLLLLRRESGMVERYLCGQSVGPHYRSLFKWPASVSSQWAAATSQSAVSGCRTAHCSAEPCDEGTGLAVDRSSIEQSTNHLYGV